VVGHGALRASLKKWVKRLFYFLMLKFKRIIYQNRHKNAGKHCEDIRAWVAGKDCFPPEPEAPQEGFRLRKTWKGLRCEENF